MVWVGCQDRQRPAGPDKRKGSADRHGRNRGRFHSPGRSFRNLKDRPPKRRTTRPPRRGAAARIRSAPQHNSGNRSPPARARRASSALPVRTLLGRGKTLLQDFRDGAPRAQLSLAFRTYFWPYHANTLQYDEKPRLNSTPSYLISPYVHSMNVPGHSLGAQTRRLCGLGAPAWRLWTQGRAPFSTSRRASQPSPKRACEIGMVRVAEVEC